MEIPTHEADAQGLSKKLSPKISKRGNRGIYHQTFMDDEHCLFDIVGQWLM